MNPQLSQWKFPILIHIFVVNHVVYVFLCTYAFYFCLWPSLCATSYIPVKSVKVLRVCLPVSAVVLSICLPLLDWFTFTDKCDCDKINYLDSMISITTILVKLLQMIWCHLTSFVVCQSVCLFVCIFERYAFHIIMILCPVRLILEERPGVPVLTGN